MQAAVYRIRLTVNRFEGTVWVQEGCMGGLRRETLGDQLYSLLRSRILSGELVGGKRVTQGELAAEVGVSRIPVRDALRRLESEGLVVGDELGRFTIVRFEIDDAREIYAIRRRLETLAVELAMERLQAHHVDELRMLLDAMDDVARRGRPEEYVALNLQFHFAIYEASESPRLVRLIRRTWSGVPTLTPIKLASRMHNSLAEHEAIFDRIAAGDSNGAAAALDRHLENALIELTADLAHQPPAQTAPAPNLRSTG
jgi:DNA-binding GntR family transcriptional regulator